MQMSLAQIWFVFFSVQDAAVWLQLLSTCSKKKKNVKKDSLTTFLVVPFLKWEIKYNKVVLVLESMAKHFSRFLRNYVPASLTWSIPLRPSKPFFFSSVPCLSKKKKKKERFKTKPHAGPQVPSFKLPSRSLWLLRWPRRDDLFCFASLVPSVVRAGLSVPQHGNVMVARGGWRCFRSRRLVTRPAPSPRFSVRDPCDTSAVAVFTYLFTHLGMAGAQMCFARADCRKFGGDIFNWYREAVWKFLKLWQPAAR